MDRWSDGVGWLAHPDEVGERASHAVKGDDGVWVIDPVGGPGVDELVVELGDVVGIAVLSSHQARDAGRIATRHGAAVHIPQWMGRVPDRVDVPVRRDEAIFGESGFDTIRVEPLSLYQGAIHYRESDGTLIVPDLLSSGSGYPVGDERIGLMFGLRPFPPEPLFKRCDPDRILFGHGRGVFEDADMALEEALTGARRRSPRALIENLHTNLRLFVAAMRE